MNWFSGSLSTVIISTNNYPLKTNMIMESPSFEDVFPIEHEDFPLPF